MENIIIALPKRKESEKIGRILTSFGIETPVIYSSLPEILSASGKGEPGILIMGENLNNISYFEVCEYLPENYDVILLSEGINDRSIRDGVVGISIPFRPEELIKTIDIICSVHERRILKKQKHHSIPFAGRSVKDKQIIDRAKRILMEKKDMEEPEAHRYLQKCSMDAGVSLVESAKKILTVM
ncbi:MAG: ANTAR domain-containing protein [Lachnospiraceae bacterium]|nr:ANTAR domain-containing protein [Lachnospiraceae bacterium]